jgi:ribosomal protein S18 acetylase RimI-like enzyme
MAAAADRQDEPGTIQAFTLGAEPVAAITVAGVRFIDLTGDREATLAAVMRVATEALRRRLAESGSAALALTGEEIVGYGWVRYGALRIPDLRLEVPLPKDHAYIWDCLTLPPHRGRGIFPGLLRFLLEELRERGFRQAWAATAPGNTASVRAFAKAGFRLVATTYGGTGSLEARPTPRAMPEEAAWLRSRFPRNRR